MNSSQVYSWVKERATQTILWLTYTCGTKSTHKQSYTSDISSDHKMSFQLDLYQELSSQFFFSVCLHVFYIVSNDISDINMSFVYQKHIYVYVFFMFINAITGHPTRNKSCKARYLANIDFHANFRMINPIPPWSRYTFNCNHTGCRRVFLTQIGAWRQVDQILCW